MGSHCKAYAESVVSGVMKRHDFQNAARLFRAGRLSLNEFTDQVLGTVPASESDAMAQPTDTLATSKQSAEHSVLPVATVSSAITSNGRFATVDRKHVVLPSLPEDSHKGDCGRVLIIAGSRSMPGAAALAGLAALRAGAGLVTVAVPASIQAIVAGFSPCLMTYPLPEQSGQLSLEAINELAPLADSSDVIAIGPGLGRSGAVVQLVVKIYQRWKSKLLVDADGLNALAVANVVWQEHAGPRLFTPHPGEFLRVCQAWWRNDRQQSPKDLDAVSRRETLEELAITFAKTSEVTVVLKGRGTVITDGTTNWRNPTGNPGMATAGSGDVLTGIIAALWARQTSPLMAAKIGCWLHGRAGDLSAANGSQPTLIATDLLDYLAPAFREIGSAS